MIRSCESKMKKKLRHLANQNHFFGPSPAPEHLFRNVSQELIQTSSKIEKKFQPPKTSQQLVDQEKIETADENDLSGLYRK